MAFMIKQNDLRGIIFLMLLTIPSIATTNIDCYGKAFHCVNSTHFMICVDLGSGVSSTIDDFVIPCPPTTACQHTNNFECEFITITTTTYASTPQVIEETSTSYTEVTSQHLTTQKSEIPNTPYEEFSVVGFTSAPESTTVYQEPTATEITAINIDNSIVTETVTETLHTIHNELTTEPTVEVNSTLFEASTSVNVENLTTIHAGDYIDVSVASNNEVTASISDLLDQFNITENIEIFTTTNTTEYPRFTTLATSISGTYVTAQSTEANITLEDNFNIFNPSTLQAETTSVYQNATEYPGIYDNNTVDPIDVVTTTITDRIETTPIPTSYTSYDEITTEISPLTENSTGSFVPTISEYHIYSENYSETYATPRETIQTTPDLTDQYVTAPNEVLSTTNNIINEILNTNADFLATENPTTMLLPSTQKTESNINNKSKAEVNIENGAEILNGITGIPDHNEKVLQENYTETYAIPRETNQTTPNLSDQYVTAPNEVLPTTNTIINETLNTDADFLATENPTTMPLPSTQKTESNINNKSKAEVNIENGAEILNGITSIPDLNENVLLTIPYEYTPSLTEITYEVLPQYTTEPVINNPATVLETILFKTIVSTTESPFTTPEQPISVNTFSGNDNILQPVFIQAVTPESLLLETPVTADEVISTTESFVTEVTSRSVPELTPTTDVIVTLAITDSPNYIEVKSNHVDNVHFENQIVASSPAPKRTELLDTSTFSHIQEHLVKDAVVDEMTTQLITTTVYSTFTEATNSPAYTNEMSHTSNFNVNENITFSSLQRPEVTTDTPEFSEVNGNINLEAQYVTSTISPITDTTLFETSIDSNIALTTKDNISDALNNTTNTKQTLTNERSTIILDIPEVTSPLPITMEPTGSILSKATDDSTLMNNSNKEINPSTELYEFTRTTPNEVSILTELNPASVAIDMEASNNFPTIPLWVTTSNESKTSSTEHPYKAEEGLIDPNVIQEAIQTTPLFRINLSNDMIKLEKTTTNEPSIFTEAYTTSAVVESANEYGELIADTTIAPIILTTASTVSKPEEIHQVVTDKSYKIEEGIQDLNVIQGIQKPTPLSTKLPNDLLALARTPPNEASIVTQAYSTSVFTENIQVVGDLYVIPTLPSSLIPPDDNRQVPTDMPNHTEESIKGLNVQQGIQTTEPVYSTTDFNFVESTTIDNAYMNNEQMRSNKNNFDNIVTLPNIMSMQPTSTPEILRSTNPTTVVGEKIVLSSNTGSESNVNLESARSTSDLIKDTATTVLLRSSSTNPTTVVGEKIVLSSNTGSESNVNLESARSTSALIKDTAATVLFSSSSGPRDSATIPQPTTEFSVETTITSKLFTTNIESSTINAPTRRTSDTLYSLDTKVSQATSTTQRDTGNIISDFSTTERKNNYLSTITSPYLYTTVFPISKTDTNQPAVAGTISSSFSSTQGGFTQILNVTPVRETMHLNNNDFISTNPSEATPVIIHQEKSTQSVGLVTPKPTFAISSTTKEEKSEKTSDSSNALNTINLHTTTKPQVEQATRSLNKQINTAILMTNKPQLQNSILPEPQSNAVTNSIQIPTTERVIKSQPSINMKNSTSQNEANAKLNETEFIKETIPTSNILDQDTITIESIMINNSVNVNSNNTHSGITFNTNVKLEQPHWKADTEDDENGTKGTKIHNVELTTPSLLDIIVTTPGRPDLNIEIIDTKNNKPIESVPEVSTELDTESKTTSLPKSTWSRHSTSIPIPRVESTSETTRNFVCRINYRGRFADSQDCRKYYICIGKQQPIQGICPLNTVFSEIRKQCTKNLSHCVRNNQFQCLSEGRFSDFLNDNLYYVCVKNNIGSFVRFKLQCQNGYHLNKTSVVCELNTESSHSTSSDNSKNMSDVTAPKALANREENNSFECEKEGKFGDPDDCRVYYICKKAKKTEYRRKRKKCDSDEVYHKDKKKCVDAESYECP